ETFKELRKTLNNSYDRVYQSHIRQLESRKTIQNEAFPTSECIFRSGLEERELQTYDLIIALGGDNHFTYIGHYCMDYQVPILGCNSDVKTSLGALLYFSPQSLVATIQNNWQGICIENWPLVFAKITYPDNSVVETMGCISEISIRNNNPDLISHYYISYQDTIEEQKSSGVLLATGAGSTGWYQSGHYNQDIDKSFAKESNFFQVYARELSKSARRKYKLTDFPVYQECTFISDMDGGISIDCLPERVYPFPPGTIAEFQLSQKTLTVLKPAELA
ncbi:MAG: NAD+ kinase, partial [Spirochaetota bacterium]